MKCKSIDCDNHPFDTEEQAHRNARNTKYGLNGVVGQKTSNEFTKFLIQLEQVRFG